MRRDNKEITWRETSALLKELGWGKMRIWNNRTFYKLTEDIKEDYVIFEHNLDIGIYQTKEDGIDFRLLYYNMSYEDFLNYTMLVKSILDAESNPQKVTLFDYNNRCDAYAKFVNKLKENHDNQYKMFL